MEINVISEDEQITDIALSGRLDIAGMHEIELKFIAHTASRGKPVLIDMEGVDFISSIGLRMILSSAKTLKKRDSIMLLYNLQPLVREIFSHAGLESLLAHSDSKADVIIELTGKQS